MKHYKTKIFTVLVLAMTVAGVTACGQNASQNAVTYNEAYLDSVADFLIANWAGMSESEIASISELDADDAQALIDANGLPFEADAFTTGFSAYAGVAEDLGAYVDTVEYSTPVVSGDEITLDVEVQYEHRTADISLVFDADSIVQSVDVSPHYTMGEILYKAVMNTIIGMGTVFLVLIFISLVIYCFKFIPAIQKKFSRKKKSESTEPVAPVASEPMPAAGPEPTEELADDTELVAAITAAICAYEGTSADGFVVRSIRRADRTSWNRA